MSGYLIPGHGHFGQGMRGEPVGDRLAGMDFGVTVLPDPPFSRWLELIRLAERHGFGYAWTYDSHVLWQESVPMLAVAARETSKIRLGHFVTNPATRDPTVLASAYATLHDLSDGRMAMGVGRGDSAVRYIGRQPMKVAEFERSCAMVRELMNGGEVEWEKIWSIEPIPFDDRLIELADESIREVAGSSHRLPSGPLHDAAEVARAGIPTVMLFVQSLRGLSHTKLEDTKEEHLELSVQALDRLTTKALGLFGAE